MDVFRVRLNCIDHYQAAPTKYDPQLRNDVRASQLAKEPKLPVVRVFGSTETGQKVCAHIHGALPYLYIEYEGSLVPEHVGAYIYRLHLSIDHALAVSYRRNVYDGGNKYVARITLAKGIPFYGMHVGYKIYLKIYMLNPMVMTRLAELLQQGVIMKRKFQPYEAHLQYLLQFMTDFNLYGCDYISAANVVFRAPLPTPQETQPSGHVWNSQSIPAAQVTDIADLPRVSHCSIEVDICVQDILNRQSVTERRLHHDFVERKDPLPSDIKLVNSMAGLWKDETKRRKRRMQQSNPGSSPFPPDALVSMSADPRESQVPGWIHEDEYRDQINDLIRQEEQQFAATNVSFQTFVHPVPLEETIKTLSQSVEDLFPSNLAPALGLSPRPAGEDEDPSSSILVDENRILDFGHDGIFPDDSDEEMLSLHQTKDKLSSEKVIQRQIRETNEAQPASKSVLQNPAGKPDGSGNNVPPSLSNHLNRDLPSNLPDGVCISCIQLSEPPTFPSISRLVEAAQAHGLVGRAPPDKGGRGRGRPTRPKRSISPAPQAGEPKRRRVNFFDDPISVQANAMDANENGHTLEVHTAANAGKQNNTTSAQKQKRKPASDPARRQTLRFPVVKDPHDPDTKLRLSQQTGSQQSQEDPPKKHVTFEPRTPTTESSATTLTVRSAKKIPDEISLPTPKSPVVNQHLFVGCEPRSQAAFYSFNKSPPPVDQVLSSMQSLGLPDVIYQDAFYSDDKDIPQRVREYAGQEFRLEGTSLPYLPEFDPTGSSPATFGMKSEVNQDTLKDESAYEETRRECSIRHWDYAVPPPTAEEVRHWWRGQQMSSVTRKSGPQIKVNDPELRPFMSQIDGPTPKNPHGFKYSQRKKSTSVQHEAQYMSTMSLEIHVNTRGKLVPNPDEDEVQCIFWCTKSDENFATSDGASLSIQSGIIILSEDGSLAHRVRKEAPIEVIEEDSELELFVRMVEIVRTHDPDILTGYEVHGSSWGYLIERARTKYDYNLCDEFSRMRTQSFGRFGKESDRWGFNTTSTIRVTGRHMINIWRAMRGELNLLQYTMENVVWHLLHRRIPHYPWKTLTDWYTDGKVRNLSKLLRYYITRTKLDIEILERNELIPRTSEQARLLGVDFFSVFSRGSQFKVESIMFRIAKPENFALVSPDRKQVGSQNALECLPLVMEPQSAFYNSPLLVLDFQSLYPSVMIAYNYCYSTFLGRITNWRGASKMGFTEYQRQEKLLSLLKDYVNIAPNGIMYCKAEIRKSLLAKMLTEILETRLMVKSGMKQDKNDKTLQQLLNNRQLALKLLANVTYGYTSASFSGRMPCSEIADSIVQTGRETLERAIALIHSVGRWKAEVVYGDTDSLFVYLPGRTKDQAFDIGDEIAKTITDMNPRPVKLKFEKVYHPCVLLAKKRYVGYKYESRDQAQPDFDAKGIETVRRDGTPAEQKIEEKALKILFETADLSQVKSYFQRQCEKIMRGAVSIQDFCFAREVKLGTYAERNGAPPPPGALISTRRMLNDARAEPQYGERVPYVVVSGAPGARLIDRCIAPEELLAAPHLQLDAEYYITKNLIPPLERIFNLVGANVRLWYDEMPKVLRVHRVAASVAESHQGLASGGGGLMKKTLESYMKAAACVVCGAKTTTPRNANRAGQPESNSAAGDGQEQPINEALCKQCQADAPGSLLQLQTRLGREEKRALDVARLCRSCAGIAPGPDPVPCDSKDCPVFYSRMKQGARYWAEKAAVEPAVQALLADVERGTAALEW